MIFIDVIAEELEEEEKSIFARDVAIWRQPGKVYCTTCSSEAGRIDVKFKDDDIGYKVRELINYNYNENHSTSHNNITTLYNNTASSSDNINTSPNNTILRGSKSAKARRT